MNVAELNESSKFDFNFEDGIVVYLNKRDKTFEFADTKQAKKRGLTFTIKSKKDYEKLARQYDIEVSQDDFIKFSNDYKKNTRTRKKSKDVTEMDKDMSRALAAMQQDIMNMSRD